jgi:hypothetical protein
VSKHYQSILNSFKSQTKKILSIPEFDRDILEPIISSLNELDNDLKGQGIDNRKLRPYFALTLLNNLYDRGHERAKYKPILNQCVVLLVSYFGSAISDIFQVGINNLVVKPSKLNSKMQKTELKFNLKELADYKFDLKDLIGELLVKKTDISFQDMQSIYRVFDQSFGIKIEWDVKVSNIILSQALRHVIVHNSEVIDEKCLNQLRNAESRTIKKNINLDEKVSFIIDDVTTIATSMVEYSEKLVSMLNDKHES